MQFLLSQTAANNVRLDFGRRQQHQPRSDHLYDAGERDAARQAAPRAEWPPISAPADLNTTATIDSIRKLDDGIEAHWVANLGGGCIERGRLTGVVQ